MNRMYSFGSLLAVAALCAACAEASNPTSTTQGGSGGGGAATSSGGAGTAGGGAGGGGGGGAPSGIDAVVINEIGAVGADYVELVNIGTTTVQLEGHGVTDSTDTDEPRLDAVMRFPEGAQIAAGERLLIVGEQDPADGVGPHGDCLSGPDTCYWAPWAISASNGEKVYFLAPDDEVIHDKKYPADGAKDGNSWGRLPDGTGDFQETLGTPGAVNVAP